MADFPLDQDQVYLFSYDFCGSRYSIEVPAKSASEARMRVSQMANAELDGMVHLKIRVAPGPVSKMLAILGRWRSIFIGGS